jgi:HD-GYP domain-containing protein (c-di-GMP phosphodiesterase class II)
MELPVGPTQETEAFSPLAKGSQHEETARRLAAAGNRLKDLRQRVTGQSLDAAHTVTSVLAHYEAMDPSRNATGIALEEWRATVVKAQHAEAELDLVLSRRLSMNGDTGEQLRTARSLCTAIRQLLQAGGGSIQMQTALLPALTEMVEELNRRTAVAEATAQKQIRLSSQFASVAKLHRGVLEGRFPEIAELESLALDITTDVEQGLLPVAAIHAPDNQSDWILDHSLRTASVVAFLSGQDERWRPYRLHLVAAALLQNVGMHRIAAESLQVNGPLTESVRAELERHPLLASIALESVAGFPAELAAATGKHHERLDGSGYPGRLTGDAIDASARLLGVAEVYAALRAERPHRQELSPQRALTEVLRLADAHQLDAGWSRGLLNLSFYAVGCTVQLTTGETAEVVASQEARTEPYLATLPVVRLLTDQAGKRLASPIYRNLAFRPDCRILRQIS